MDSKTGERSYTLDLSLSDLLTLITAVETLMGRVQSLHFKLMAQMMPSPTQSQANPFGPEQGYPLDQLQQDLRKLFEQDPDGIGAEEVGSETPNAPTAKKIGFRPNSER